MSIQLLQRERPNSSEWCEKWSRHCCGSEEPAWENLSSRGGITPKEKEKVKRTSSQGLIPFISLVFIVLFCRGWL